MLFARAQDEFRRIQNEVSSTSRLILDSQKWFSLSSVPSQDCDVILTFSEHTDERQVEWFVNVLEERVPELSVKRDFHERSRQHVLYLTASYRNLLRGAEEIGLKRRLRPHLGGGFREFHLEDIQLYEDVDEPAKFLSTQERQDIVRHFLYSVRAQACDRIPRSARDPRKRKLFHFLEGQRIVPHLQSRKFIKQVFPLHDRAALRELSTSWVQAFFRRQPLDKIRDYFGVRIALYFAWLGHYTSALIFPTLFGLVAWKVAGREFFEMMDDSRAEQDNRDLYYVASALFNVVWATLYLEHWKRSSSELAYRWGTLDCTSELLEEPRPLFEGSPSVCPVTNHMVPHYPPWKRQLIRYCISMPIVMLCLFAVFCSMLGIFWLQELICTLIGAGSLPPIVNHAPKVLLALTVGFMGEVYKRIAVWLNDLENYRQEESYMNNLIVKLILFQFVNNFLSLFYIAFYLRDLKLLKHQLAALLITKQLIGNVKEVLLPFLMCKVRQYQIGIRYEKQKKEERDGGASSAAMSQAEEEATMEQYNDPYEDYLEMFIQFGYVSMFACAFPLAGLFCLLNNLVEIRSDAFKLVTGFQRPFGERAATIGIWQQAMEAMSGLAIVVNVALLGVSGGVHRLLPDLAPWQVVLLLAGLEHVVIFLKAGIAIAIPDLPQWIEEEMAKVEYRRREALKTLEYANMKEISKQSAAQTSESAAASEEGCDSSMKGDLNDDVAT